MKKIAAALLIIITALLLFACGGEIIVPKDEVPAKVTVTEIIVNENSFKGEYLVGETIDYSNAVLTVKYSNQNSKQIPISENMMRDFYTTREGVYRAYVGYGDRETSFIYTVVTARLTAKRVTKNENGVLSEIGAEVGIEGAANIENGISGMLFKISNACGRLSVKAGGGVESKREGFSPAYVYTNNSGTVNFIFEDAAQKAKITADGALFTVWYDVTDTPVGDYNYIFISASASNLAKEINLKTIKIDNIAEVKN